MILPLVVAGMWFLAMLCILLPFWVSLYDHWHDDD